MSEPLVVIGNGMAAARLVDELAARALGRYAIAVVGEEPRLAYNRVLLSSLLANEADGRTLGFSKLVFATGSRPLMLPLPGGDLPGVIGFRDLGDVDAMAGISGPGRRIVVIGGGLLGIEAAYGLAKSGARVTLIHLMDRLMERQLDAPAAAMLRQALEERGVRVLLEAQTQGVLGHDRAESVQLADGRVIPADLVVMAVGIRPNAELARGAGIAVERGVVVDDHLETSAAGVHAIGECAQHRGQCYGLVEPGYEQARVLARRLAGEAVAYPGSLLSTNLKVSGVNVFSAGAYLGGDGAEEIILSDPGLRTYKKLVIADGRLIGAVLFGDTADALWYLDLIRSGETIERIRDDLVFGRALAMQAA